MLLYSVRVRILDEVFKGLLKREKKQVKCHAGGGGGGQENVCISVIERVHNRESISVLFLHASPGASACLQWGGVCRA